MCHVPHEWVLAHMETRRIPPAPSKHACASRTSPSGTTHISKETYMNQKRPIKMCYIWNVLHMKCDYMWNVLLSYIKKDVYFISWKGRIWIKRDVYESIKTYWNVVTCEMCCTWNVWHLKYVAYELCICLTNELLGYDTCQKRPTNGTYFILLHSSMCMYVCVCTCMHTTYIYKWYIDTYIHIYLVICIHIYICIYIYVNIYI